MSDTETTGAVYEWQRCQNCGVRFTGYAGHTLCMSCTRFRNEQAEQGLGVPIGGVSGPSPIPRPPLPGTQEPGQIGAQWSAEQDKKWLTQVWRKACLQVALATGCDRPDNEMEMTDTEIVGWATQRVLDQRHQLNQTREQLSLRMEVEEKAVPETNAPQYTAQGWKKQMLELLKTLDLRYGGTTIDFISDVELAHMVSQRVHELKEKVAEHQYDGQQAPQFPEPYLSMRVMEQKIDAIKRLVELLPQSIWEYGFHEGIKNATIQVPIRRHHEEEK